MVDDVGTEEGKEWANEVIASLAARLLGPAMLMVSALVLSPLAAVAGSPTDAERERQQLTAIQVRADGLRLLVHSATTLPKDPTLALLLAIEGARRAPGELANNALQSALDACHEERILPQDPLPACGLTLLPNGTVLAARSGQRVRILDPGTGKEVRTWLAHPKSALVATPSPDGRRIVTVGETTWSVSVVAGPARKNLPAGMPVSQMYSNRVARVWDAATGKQVCILRGHTGRVAMASFSTDGKKVITASYDGTARIWDAKTGKELRALKCDGSLAWARFSCDGNRVLTLAADRQYEEVPFRHADEEIDPEQVAPDTENFSGGGTGGFSATSPQLDGACARIWDVETGKQVARLASPAGAWALALGICAGFGPSGGEISPDGKLAVIGFAGRKEAAWLWDPATGEVLMRLRSREEGSSIPPTFSPNGKKVLFTAGKLAHVAPAEEGAPVIVLRGHEEGICSASFSADGKKVLTAAEDGTARVWDAETGEPLACFRRHDGRVLSAIFLPGDRVLSCGEDGTLRIWTLTAPRLEHMSLGHPLPVDHLAYSSDGRYLLTVGEDSRVHVWDVATRRQVAVLHGLGELKNAGCRDDVLGTVLSASFSPDGNRVLVLNNQARVRFHGWFGKEEKAPPFAPVRVFETQSGKELLAFHGGRGGVIHASFSPDGKKVLVAEWMHVRTGSGSRTGLSSQGGDRCASPEARIHDSQTGTVLVRLPVHAEGVVACTWSPDGRRVATACKAVDLPGAHCVRLWDASTGKLLREVKEDDTQVPADFDMQGRPTRFEKRRCRAGDVCQIAFSPDGKRLVTFPTHLGEGRGRVWDSATGKRIGSFQGLAWARTTSKNGQPQQPLQPFSPTGDSFVAVAGSIAWVYECSSGRVLHTLSGHTTTVCSAGFSRDGKWVFTASADGTARVWEAKTGKPWRTFSGHAGAVTHAVFSPDGKYLATASADKTTRLWALDLLAIAEARKPRSLTPAERSLYEIEGGGPSAAGK